MRAETELPFLKMHGLGNDFVILDARARDLTLDADHIRQIGHRHFGVGFDQLAVIGTAKDADASIRFFNADGSEAAACGNATRCVARLLFDETGRKDIRLFTNRGALLAKDHGEEISVNMGVPQLKWDEIPLAKPVDLDALPLAGAPSAVGMGNPHCVFFVEDLEGIDLAQEGAKFETDPLFPERANIEFVEVLSRDKIRMKVWERGGMITLACGSGACAAAVASHRRGLTAREVLVALDGGELKIRWEEDGVWMRGPTQKVFLGRLSAELFT